jgi:hypothetical protein
MKRQRLTSLSCVMLGSLLTSQLAVAGDVEPLSKLQLMDVFELEYAADPRISPDGKRVAYLRTGMDIMQDQRQSKLWMVNVDGSAHRPLVAPDKGSISHPRWSPDGTRIAYVTNVTDNGPAQVYCLWPETGQIVRLTQLPAGPGHLTWSPDGKSIALTMLVEESAEPFVKLPAAPKGAKWAAPPKVIRKVLYEATAAGTSPTDFGTCSLFRQRGELRNNLPTATSTTTGPFPGRPTAMPCSSPPIATRTGNMSRANRNCFAPRCPMERPSN